MLFFVPENVEVAEHGNDAHGKAGPGAKENVGDDIGYERGGADDDDLAFVFEEIGPRQEGIHNDGKNL